MNHFNYSEVKDLFQKYRELQLPAFTSQAKDLASEFANALNDLEQISTDIVEINSQLFDIAGLTPNDKDEIELMGIRLKLKRANPNVPIKLDNVLRAYSRGDEVMPVPPEIRAKERKLERLALEFYRVAHRIAHIAVSLPGLEKFTAEPIRIIRNNLIEHPEGGNSGITHDSFSYTKNEGPYIKGLRVGDKKQHMDRGFKVNND